MRGIKAWAAVLAAGWWLTAVGAEGTGAAPAAADRTGAAKPAAPKADASKADAKAGEASDTRLVRNGVVVDFSLTPANGDKRPVMAEELADVRFKITQETNGEPLRGAGPGAWMDMAQVLGGKPGIEQKSCKDKVSLYMQGAVGIRPIIDLNSYYVLVMDAGSDISVVDPVVSMAGATSTLTQIRLASPGTDWATSADQKRLYVSSPTAGKVALIDSEAFKLIKNVDAGKNPTRVALQPDGKYLWIGNDGKNKGESGVTVLDTDRQAVVGFIPTGAGHHELAFTGDSRYVFVSNRDEGTVTVIDVVTRKKVKDLKTGSLPISIAFSGMSKSLYVADGKDGTITVFDGTDLKQVKKIELKPGLGPLRFTHDGRYGMVVNPTKDAVYVVDASSNDLANTVDIQGEPYQITFSETFGYVRALRSERVSMIDLRSVGKGSKASVQSFPAGARPPAGADNLAIADTIGIAPGEGAVFVVNPVDNSTYYYAEGMNAPSSNYTVKGSRARAVTVVDRSLKEVEPGVYAGKVRLPADGRYDVAFLMQTPQLLHCFAVEVKPNPAATAKGPVLTVKYDDKQRTVKAGEPLKFRFTLVDPRTGKPKTGMQDARVMYYLAPGRMRTEAPVKEIGDGVYEVELRVQTPGAYYVYVGVPSLKLTYGQLPFFSLRAVQDPAQEKAGGKKG